jgi:hypothetical protein
MINEVLANVIHRNLVVYDNEDKCHYKMGTVWTNEEVEGIRIYKSPDSKWKFISEHQTEEEALSKANELNNGV